MSKFNTPNKYTIRNEWDKPILKTLAEQLGEKLVYFGLPSPDAEDITDWIDYLSVVIAFQCRNYPYPSDPEQPRDEILKLFNYLNKLERESKIENFVVYDGYLEEVILRGDDNSPQLIKFNMDRFITLFNLDFCNNILSPIEYVDENGHPRKGYKFDAINKLIELQSCLKTGSSSFVFFLTIHCHYDGEEIRNFIENPPQSWMKNYISDCNKLKKLERKKRILRLFVYDSFYSSFKEFSLSFSFLPVIFYSGINDVSLLHFCVLSDSQPKDPFNSDSKSVIKEAFITVNGSTFESVTPFLDEIEIDVNSILQKVVKLIPQER